MEVSSELPPDLTRAFVDWLKARHPMPEWSGKQEDAPDYFKDLGVHRLALELEGYLNEEHEAEDAQQAL